MAAMDKLWAEGGGAGGATAAAAAATAGAGGAGGAAAGGGGGGAGAGGGPPPAVALDAAAAAQAAARLAAALEDDDGGEGAYVQVASRQMVGLYLTIWARRRTARHIRGVQTTSAATGWGGYVGNKGAVAARLRVHDAPLAVVCAHLASGDGEGDAARRSADAADVLRRCTFPTDAQVAALGLAGAGPPGHWGGAARVDEGGGANVIFLGDLNYRLDAPDAEVRRHVAAGRWERLLEADQLRREMEAGRAFRVRGGGRGKQREVFLSRGGPSPGVAVLGLERLDPGH